MLVNVGCTLGFVDNHGSPGGSIAANDVRIFGTLTDAACTGTITRAADAVIINSNTSGALVTPGGGELTVAIQHILTGGATLTVTGTGTCIIKNTVDGDSLLSGRTITIEGDLLCYPDDVGDVVNLQNTDITVGGSVALVCPTQEGGAALLMDTEINIDAATITGPNIAGATFGRLGTVIGTATIIGFEPLYNVGGGSVLSSFGSGNVIVLPDPSTVVAKDGAGNTVVYGPPDNQQEGEAPIGRGMVVIGSME